MLFLRILLLVVTAVLIFYFLHCLLSLFILGDHFNLPYCFWLRRLYRWVQQQYYSSSIPESGSIKRRQPKSNYDSDLVVVLDLDECLIHTCNANGMPDPTGIVSFVCRFPSTGQSRKVLLRPGLIKFLKSITSRYETHVYTAGYYDYAEPIIQELEILIDGEFAGCHYRESCKVKRYMKTDFLSKDLKHIRHEVNRIVLIDDDPTNFEYNPDNGIPIRPFRGDDCVNTDSSLESVAKLIQELDAAEDVRTILGEHFKISKAFEVAREIYTPLHLQWEHVYKCGQLVQL